MCLRRAFRPFIQKFTSAPSYFSKGSSNLQQPRIFHFFDSLVLKLSPKMCNVTQYKNTTSKIVPLTRGMIKSAVLTVLVVFSLTSFKEWYLQKSSNYTTLKQQATIFPRKDNLLWKDRMSSGSFWDDNDLGMNRVNLLKQRFFEGRTCSVENPLKAGAAGPLRLFWSSLSLRLF